MLLSSCEVKAGLRRSECRAPHVDEEAVALRAAFGAQPIVDAGTVTFAELAANVQAQAGAAAAGREKWLEQIRLDFGRNRCAVAQHAEEDAQLVPGIEPQRDRAR